MAYQVIHEIIDTCPCCTDKDGNCAVLIPQVMGVMSPLQPPDKKCPICGITYVYEEKK